ncbi:MAG: hypothetical protein KDD84_02035 [Caldilineaceae bacterium]|nr:hypothetical protein [Caldilineaceae bacterium]
MDSLRNGAKMKQATSSAGEITLEQVLVLAQRLQPVDQARLLTKLAVEVELTLEKASPTKSTEHKSLRGLLSDLGTAPSTADIDEVQREMWSGLAEE